MNVKIDTKEKFTVITPNCEDLTANMTEEVLELLHSYLKTENPHVILNLENIQSVGEKSMKRIASLQSTFYEKEASCVICCMKPAVEKSFDLAELLEIMNVTPSESEAWDIVQMEEIERELLGDL